MVVYKRYILIFCFICLFTNIYMLISFANNINKSMSNQLIIFSEHKEAYSSGHSIKLLDIVSKKELDLGIKTYSYGDFYITKGDCISWLSGFDQRDSDKLLIWNPETKNIEEKRILVELLPLVFYISISPSGNKIAYLKPINGGLYLIGQKAELHIINLVNNSEYIVTDKMAFWNAPQWSPDESKILYTRPYSDDYFEPSFLEKIKVRKNDLWQNIVQSSIFVYDLEKNVSVKLCLGAKPQWSPNGNKIAFLTKNNQIGIFDLRNNEMKELSIKVRLDVITFKVAWSPDGEYLAYLGKPEFSLISYLKALTKFYERPLSLWIIKTNGTQEQYIQTRNFGDIKFAPESYKALLKGK
ncbi:MAG: hypothetical protein ABIH18_06015 [Candidatus Omnitrophota bacterium]